MDSISRFLEQTYKKIKNRGVDQKVIIENIKHLTGIVLQKENLEIRSGSLFLKNVHGTVRNEIFFYKDKIIEACRASGLAVTDIR